MPSLAAKIMRKQIQLLKPVFDNGGLESSRSGQDKAGALGVAANLNRIVVENHAFDGFDCCWVYPRESFPEKGRAILYLHGGGYVAGGMMYARGFASILAVNTGIPVFAVAYRLAPENPYPAALSDALASYRYLLEEEGIAPERIAFVGESAGGGLVYCLCLKAREASLPMPACLVALSPWTDLMSQGASYRLNADVDPGMTKNALQTFAQMYAPGEDLKNPLISPIYGDLKGLPDSFIISGGDEVMLSDASDMADRLTLAGCRAQLDVCPGMWHVYPLYGIPEGRDAILKISEYLNEKCPSH